MNRNGEGNESGEKHVAHYYGDTVRACFLSAGAVLLFAVLRDDAFIKFYLSIGIGFVLLLTVLAGLMSPLKRSLVFINTLISGFGFAFFEYFALINYIDTNELLTEVFILRQLLALIFIIALYYSTKTFRGMLVR